MMQTLKSDIAVDFRGNQIAKDNGEPACKPIPLLPIGIWDAAGGEGKSRRNAGIEVPAGPRFPVICHKGKDAVRNSSSLIRL